MSVAEAPVGPSGTWYVCDSDVLLLCLLYNNSEDLKGIC